MLQRSCVLAKRISFHHRLIGLCDGIWVPAATRSYSVCPSFILFIIMLPSDYMTVLPLLCIHPRTLTALSILIRASCLTLSNLIKQKQRCFSTSKYRFDNTLSANVSCFFMFVPLSSTKLYWLSTIIILFTLDLGEKKKNIPSISTLFIPLVYKWGYKSRKILQIMSLKYIVIWYVLIDIL